MQLLNFINGRLQLARSGRWIEVFEPATGQPYAQVAASDGADVDEAVAAAAAVFENWAATPAEERCRLMLRIADGIEQRLEAFAEAESRDTGKPLKLARSVDIPRAVKNFRFFATAILHQSSELHLTDRAALNYTLRRPRGVAGVISPWNLPLYLLSWKIAPAIAVGNTVVAKPSEVTPLTAVMLAEVCIGAGLPPGVINIIHGEGAAAGEALVRHPGVGTLSFTGSTRTGKRLAEMAGPMLKKISLELGGKNPNIVFADADIEEAVETGVRAAFSNQGQICLCGSRIFVERPLYKEFLDCFVERVRGLRMGDPNLAETDLGALVSKLHLKKVTDCVERARAEGGRILLGGGKVGDLGERCRGGYFYPPTVIVGLGPSCATNQEEIFGPVVTVMPFDTESEVLAAANGTPYGLSATVWTRDLERAHRLAERLEAGTVWVNCWLVRDLRVPFGGVKESGVGREGGDEALRFFTEPKNVCVRMEWDSPS